MADNGVSAIKHMLSFNITFIGIVFFCGEKHTARRIATLFLRLFVYMQDDCRLFTGCNSENWNPKNYLESEASQCHLSGVHRGTAGMIAACVPQSPVCADGATAPSLGDS